MQSVEWSLRIIRAIFLIIGLITVFIGCWHIPYLIKEICTNYFEQEGDGHI